MLAIHTGIAQGSLIKAMPRQPRPKAPPAEFAANQKPSLPRPQFRKVRDDESRQTAFKIFEYWASVPDEAAPLVEFNVYRTFPVTDSKLIGKDRTVEDVIGGKIPFKWEDWREEMLYRFGSGGYHVYLNESGVPGSIMEAYFTLKDWEHYPPKIDLRTIIRGEPANESYIEWLRKRGEVLPWDDPEREAKEQKALEEVGDMAASVEAIKAMSEQNNRMVDMMQSQVQDAKQGNAAETAFNNRGADLVAHAAEKGFDILEKRTERIIDQAAPQYNPVDMIEKLAPIMRVPDQSASHLEMTRIMMESSDRKTDQMITMLNNSHQQMVALLTTPRADANSTALVPAKQGLDGVLEEVEKYKRMAELFGWSRQNSNLAPVEREPQGKGIFGSIAEGIAANPQAFFQGVTGIFALGANIVYNLFGKGGQSPQEAVAKANGQAQATAGQPGQNGAQSQLQWPMSYVADLAPAFLRHYSNPDASGYTLAEWALSDGLGAGATDEGRRKYDMLRAEFGPQINDQGQITGFPFHNLIVQLPPLWTALRHPQKNLEPGDPKKYWDFLMEFFTYDQYMAAQQEEDQKPDSKPVPVSNAPTA